MKIDKLLDTIHLKKGVYQERQKSIQKIEKLVKQSQNCIAQAKSA